MVRHCLSPVTLQIAGVAIGLAVLAFAPPASGRMLLVPLDSASAKHLVPLALARGGLLMGAGPLPYSYVVYGDRSRLFGSMARNGIVTLAAPPAACGDMERTA